MNFLESISLHYPQLKRPLPASCQNKHADAVGHIAKHQHLHSKIIVREKSTQKIYFRPAVSHFNQISDGHREHYLQIQEKLH